MQKNLYPITDMELPVVKENILATLAYFDLFNYPLTRVEIYLFLQNKYDYDFFDDALESLLLSGHIFLFDKFYTLHNDHYLVVHRLTGNKKADELIKIALRVGELLIRFPYVRGIAISGSLSKNYADEKSDIDLFIITAKNRLWIARTFMHCLKKLTFLVKKEDYFCMNYYIDEQHLEIPEKSIYTAIEVGTLIPLQGDVTFEKFYSANLWIKNFIPNKIMRVSSAKPVKAFACKSFVEWMLNNRVGNAIDNMLLHITTSRWLKKTRLNKQNNHGLLLSLKTGKHFAKPDPVNFQSILLARYDRKLKQLLNDYEAKMAN
jgi:predicted nucleotidyltransferase